MRCVQGLNLIRYTEQRFEDSNMDKKMYRLWMTSDRSCCDFLESFAEISCFATFLLHNNNHVSVRTEVKT